MALSDTREQLEEVPDSTVTRYVATRLEATKQMIVFEVPDDPPEDVWLMLAQAQAFLARERDGIVVAEDGVYNAELDVILSFRS